MGAQAFLYYRGDFTCDRISHLIHRHWSNVWQVREELLLCQARSLYLEGYLWCAWLYRSLLAARKLFDCPGRPDLWLQFFKRLVARGSSHFPLCRRSIIPRDGTVTFHFFDSDRWNILSTLTLISIALVRSWRSFISDEPIWSLCSCCDCTSISSVYTLLLLCRPQLRRTQSTWGGIHWISGELQVGRCWVNEQLVLSAQCWNCRWRPKLDLEASVR